MSLPEISRRCLSCGASVRTGARFCPQCGEPFGERVERPQPDGASAGRVESASAEGGAEGHEAAWSTRVDWGAQTVRDAEGFESAQESRAPLTRDAEFPQRRDAELPRTREAEAPRFSAPPTREFHSFLQAVEGGEQNASAGADANTDAGAASAAVAEPAAAREQASGGEGVRGRVARVRENIRPRVEKMRDEALVVLEETPDDSGLRFVVIAVALFLLFVLFLLLSTTILR